MKELTPGDRQQVGKYRLLSELGSGGMGRVFLGLSPGGRQVAVKIIRPDLAGNPDFRARFTREVAAARTVSGIYTAPVVDADLDGPEPWLVTAYVDGPSLADAVARHGPVPATSLLPLAAGLAEGLGAIHAAGVVHRDLKPSNVLLASDGPRIIDFGISRVADATEVTHTGSIVGSPGFMSPEQAAGGEAGPASDIFSLGGVLTFAASGRGPFGTGDPTVMLYRVVHHQPDLSGVPPVIRDLAGRCLAKDPQQRPATEEILASLGEVGRPNGWVPWPPAHPTEGRTQSATGGPGPATPAQPPVPTAPAYVIATPPVGPPTQTWGRPPGHHDATVPEQGGIAGRRRRQAPPRLRWALAGGALAGALAAGTLFSVAHWTTAAARSPAPGRATGPVASPAGQQAATPAVSTSSGPGGTAPASSSWQAYRDPNGFSISLPAGWAVSSRTPTEVHFTGGQPGFVVVVAWTPHPTPDALADWRQQAAALARTDQTYQQISIRRVSYRGYNTADWEFTNMYRGTLTHVLDRGFIVQPGRLGYAIELYGPDAGWAPVYTSMWNRLAGSFQPAS